MARAWNKDLSRITEDLFEAVTNQNETQNEVNRPRLEEKIGRQRWLENLNDRLNKNPDRVNVNWQSKENSWKKVKGKGSE